MPESRFEIGELWRAVNRALHDRFRQAFQGCDVPFGALPVLRQITLEPGVTINELSRRSGMAKSHVSKMVDHLVRQGYIEKRADPEDQRLVRVYVTKSALDEMDEMEARAHEAWSGIVARIPPDQQKQISQGLRTLLEALQKADSADHG